VYPQKRFNGILGAQNTATNVRLATNKRRKKAEKRGAHTGAIVRRYPATR
jgi:hypothetical protein